MTIKQTPSSIFTDCTEALLRKIFPDLPVPLPRQYISLYPSQKPQLQITCQDSTGQSEEPLYTVKLYK